MDVTLKRIAEITSLNISSIRFYKDKYIQYLTTSGEGRTMKYEQDSSVAIFNLVADSYKKHMDQEQIIELIEAQYGINVTTDLAVQEDNRTITTQQVMESIREMFIKELSSRDLIIAELTEKVDSLVNRSKDRDALLMDNIRLLQEKRKPWWRFGR